MRLKIRRDDKELIKTVVLAKYPVEGEMIATNRPPDWRGLRVDSPEHRSTPPGHDPQYPARFAWRRAWSPRCWTIRPRPAPGLKKFQVIRQVEKTPVATPRQFAKAVAELKGPVTS